MIEDKQAQGRSLVALHDRENDQYRKKTRSQMELRGLKVETKDCIVHSKSSVAP